MKLALLTIFLLAGVAYGLECKDESFCSTFPKDSLLSYCTSFLSGVCPESCGKCAVETLKKKFTAALDSNADGRISVEEGQSLLKSLKIDVNDGMVTLIRDLILDSKTAITDLYKRFDANNDETLTIDEVLLGFIDFLESIGVQVKVELKEQMIVNVGVIKNAEPSVKIPKLSELIEFLTKKTESYPHGFITLVRLQKLLENLFEFDRIISESNDQKYIANGKYLIRDILEAFDLDGNNFVDHKELTRYSLTLLKRSNAVIPESVNQTVNRFFEIMDKQLISILIKYGLNDLSQLDGKELPELNNQKYVDTRLNIRKSMISPVEFSPEVIAKYIKSVTNYSPVRTLSFKTVVEAILMKFDKNKDEKLDLGELGEFSITGLKEIQSGLEDYIQVLKLMVLYDANGDNRIDLEELLNILSPIKYEVRTVQ